MSSCLPLLLPRSAIGFFASGIEPRGNALPLNYIPSPSKKNPQNSRAAFSWASVAHAYNPSYLGGRDQEDCNLRLAWGYLENSQYKKDRKVQVVEFKPQLPASFPFRWAQAVDTLNICLFREKDWHYWFCSNCNFQVLLPLIYLSSTDIKCSH
jgi:hypothetical protein